MAGLYSLFDATLDLQQLCTASGTRLIAAAANGLNPAGRVISLVDRPPIPFDLVSIAVGSIPQVADGETRSELISLKPLRDFPQRWEEAVRRLRPKPLESIDVSGSAPLKVVMVGGGAAGCEMTLALDRWLNLHKVNAEIRLVESGPEILGGGTLRTIQRMRHELHRRGIQVETSLKILGVRTAGVEDPMELQPLWLEVSRGADWPADLVVWATSGGPPPLLSRLGLPLDEQGFLMVDPTLQSVSGLPVFAAGDAAGGSAVGQCATVLSGRATPAVPGRRLPFIDFPRRRPCAGEFSRLVFRRRVGLALEGPDRSTVPRDESPSGDEFDRVGTPGNWCHRGSAGFHAVYGLWQQGACRGVV
jgi:selenide,water dikinase